jgi:hypothetical protein
MTRPPAQAERKPVAPATYTLDALFEAADEDYQGGHP